MDPSLQPLEALAQWSHWLPLADAAASASRSSGVYVARLGADGQLIYVGMAGPRSGWGVRGRLKAYVSGKGLVSGLGEAALDKALADPDWLRWKTAKVEAGNPSRAKRWGRDALDLLDIYVCWAETSNAAEALILERKCLLELTDVGGDFDIDLWNRQVPSDELAAEFADAALARATEGLVKASQLSGSEQKLADAQLFDAELYDLLWVVLRGRTTIETLKKNSENLLGPLTPMGIQVKTRRAADLGTSRPVSASLFNLAWEILLDHGYVDRVTLDQLAQGVNTKRAAPVFAILSLLPNVTAEEGAEVRLLHTGPSASVDRASRRAGGASHATTG
ncbi:MAG: hypothetical protein KAZ88_15355 [Acidimicrobiia bacterium]|nr:hypothetical protein [Acidimicrobiia bacterium]